ncbi:hypothetical protein KR054_010997, partial [Drosophila jambulina]
TSTTMIKAAARETTRTVAGDHNNIETKDFTMFHRCRRRSGIDIKSKSSPPALHPSHMLLSLVLVLLLGSSQAASSDKERERRLEVSEGVPVDHQIGYIGDFDGIDSGPPYIIVAETGVETDLAIDQSTGEIRTKVKLDRETRASYSLVAIPLSGQNIRVVVTVKDENDNAPTFLQPSMHIEFPENTPREVKRTLLPARDLDLEPYNTQKYNIVSGNVNDAFRLSSHRERDGVLYLDLQISGFLDRETTPGYSLLIEALDGGSPPLRGFMTVNITIQDVNDNQPIFNQSRYFATVPENATVGTSVLQVYASDTDADENGLVEYGINRRQSDKEQMFRIDPRSGAIYINKPLDFETKELHELVVVAKDHGEQPLETTAFVSIRVTDVNDNQPTINVIFLSDDASPKISESAQPGEFVARISVHDPDSKTEYANVNVSLNGGDGHFALTTRDNSIYLVIVNLPLDREKVSNYTLSVVATDKGTPPLHASKSIFLRITDVNDNPPEFEQDLYHANVMEVADPGTSVLQVLAHDRDEGLNSALSYSLAETPETHAQWFQIDPQTGLITTRSHIDCETEPVPQLTVIAKDGGVPPLTSTATVLVTIHDVNDNEPIFDQSFYNVSVAENEPVGRCILKVSASDPDCGVNAMVNYTLGEGFKHLTEFEVRSASGEICIAGELDFERRSSYEFPVLATDRGGLSTTAMIKMQLTDVNDNRPVFYPREYNVSLRESSSQATSQSAAASTPIVAVVATDPDSGNFGQVSYRIVAGNEAGIFRIDRSSGEIFVARPDMLSVRTQAMHMLNISATDGGGLRSRADAVVFLSIIDAMQRPPIFEKARYNYYVKEDIPRGTVVGSVIATSGDTAQRSPVRYSIYSGDPDGYFSIEANSGNIRIAKPLDHEAKSQVLLNIQATLGEPPVYGHTQVNIEVEDVNDNAPEFEASMVRISVPENAELGAPLYAAHAHDKDSGSSGQVSYSLVRDSGKRLFAIDARSGHLVLSQHLDYETSQRHSLIVTATDGGVPSLSTNLTILVDVQDVNDNPPVFEREEYSVNVSESRSINAQIIQVNASDLDTGNNARITYRIVDAGVDNVTNSISSSDVAQHFGIFPNSGWIYLRDPLDRETRDRYQLTVLATDNGTPTAHAKTRVTVRVLDANDNDPKFQKSKYEFRIEENLRRGSVVGVVMASDLDVGENAAIRYSLLPANSSFQVHPVTGEISTREPLDRELRELYDLMVEARDQGVPVRSARVPVRVHVSDVNDNAPEIADPQEDVVSVREEQPPGTEVVRIRAIDRDYGQNASITYSIVKGRDSDGHGLFSIDPSTGVIRTRVVLDHEERSIYRLGVAASDGGSPPRETVRMLRVEVLDLNDNRPTFTSSSLVFRVREDAAVGHVVGSISPSERPADVIRNSIEEEAESEAEELRITYTLNPLTKDLIEGAFDIDRHSGNLVVARLLDRELQSEFRLEIRALDTTASNNPQSSAITVKIEVADVNDNAPEWPQDPIDLQVSEATPLGTIIHNFTATDADTGTNGELQYRLLRYFPQLNESQEQAIPLFALDSLTGSLSLQAPLDFEAVQEYLLIVQALDQSSNITERLQTSVTVRLRILDANDNAPQFVSPNTNGGKMASLFISDATRIGEIVAHIVAVDEDSGDNGRINYEITGGNGEGRFRINAQTGLVELVKSLPPAPEDVDKSGGRFSLVISARDHGQPEPRRSTLNLQLIVQGSHNNPPRFLQAAYRATILENVPSGSFVLQVTAKSFHGGENANLSYEIPAGVAQDLFHVDWQRGIITTRGPFDRESQASYVLPVYVRDANRLATSSSSQSAVRKQRSSESNGDGSNGQHFDVATVYITIGDVNDNAPEFRPGSCYGLSVPENSEPGVIHTVVASDLDEGPNADLIYSITGGNLGNKFTIDARSGELSARPLDREQQSLYSLQIQASDRGQPRSRQGHCNITILVEDQNDNAPRFKLQKYVASVQEDAPLGTSVMQISAVDADLGVNARLVYSLANETQWQFAIDSESGLITTVGKLDRELQASYSFMVLATDGGRYEVRSASVSVQINVLDVNDNRPVFERYPYIGQVPALIQPGQTLLKVQAHDADLGGNGEVIYSLKAENSAVSGKFRINPSTGALSASQSLASESGKLLQLEVLARDKGNPPQSSVGLIELLVGEASQGAPVLHFQNETYRVKVKENSPAGTKIIQVVALRSDGRRQRVQFSFGVGNEDNIFSLDSLSGEIRVNKPHLLDFDRFATPSMSALNRGRALHYEEELQETSEEDSSNTTRSQRALTSTSFDLTNSQPNEMHVVIVARSTDAPFLTTYSELVIELEDENDNSPQFSQKQFVATVSEGNSKGTFVAQVQAFDSDAGSNARLRYHIVDGNHDNAFVIEPAFSGIVKTNIVLDREIRDVYNLKVIATDEGVPQMTGTATIRVQIVDINDNQPTFPPNNLVSVSEGTELGAVITSISANDVDTYPALTYRLGNESPLDMENLSIFALDRYSGKLVLKRRLDYELQQEYEVEVIASDAAHEARTILTVRVNDENDNAPIFLAQQPPAYFAILPALADISDSLSMDIELLTVNATDADAEGSNSRVQYSIEPLLEGFSVHPTSGVVSVNMSRLQTASVSPSGDYFVRISAKDGGKPAMKGYTLLRVQASDSGSGRSQFQQTQYRAQISEAAALGSIVLQLGQDVQDQAFVIASGNEEGAFELLQSKAIVLVKPLDRERNDLYKLRLVLSHPHGSAPSSSSNSTSGISVIITILDANDNFPIFDRSAKYEAEISELAPLRYSIAQLQALDADQENTPNSEVVYDITSGNDEHMFTIDLVTGVLFVNNRLDYDSGARSYELILRACDSHHPRPLCTLQPFRLELHDENDNEPKFPLSEYVHFLAENEPVGSSVFRAHASDLDKGPFGQLNYSIAPAPSDDSSWKLFRVDPETGVVTSASVFDYEQRQRYDLELQASDMGGKRARVAVRVEIESRDEFTPQFTERTYRFVLPAAVALPQGFVVGQVTATDGDSGPDGRVVYQLSAPHSHFKVNRSSGAVLIKRKLKLDGDGDGGNLYMDGRDISLVISASSGRHNSLSSMAVVEIALDPLAHPGTNLASAGGASGGGSMGDWAIGVVVAFLLILCAAAGIFLFIHMRSRKPRNVVKPHLSTETVGVGNSNSYVDPSAFDTIPIRGGITGGAAGAASGQFAPPKYDEIPPFGPHAGSSGAATTSELSGSEQSGSSGRGSAEDDGEDEEIRMINEGPLHHRNGGAGAGSDDGRISDISVQNTQEYLARLGIVDHDPSGGGGGASSMAGSSHPMHMFHDDDATARSDITNLIYAKLNDVTGAGSERGSSADDAGTTAGSIGTIGTAITHGHGVMGSYGEVPVPVPVVVGGSNVGGSLSSIVHSEEELTGSYNWDYLLDWGPQYQPLAHVFSEIARLKDDTISEHSGHSGSGASSSAKSKHSSSGAGSVVLKPPPSAPTHIPPPLLTNVAPRAINLPMRLPPHLSLAPAHLPRSPIGHEASGSFSTSSAMSPSFSPSLSPLATRSPSISPLGAGPPTHLPHVSLPRHGHAPQPSQRGNVGTRM